MKTKLLRLPAARFIICLIAASSCLQADVSVPSLFSDHMVLQRNKPIQVWGWGDPGESVKVTLNGKSSRTKTGKDGKWKVDLPSMDAGGPYVMQIAGNNNLNISDVLIGEVWVASGQSNMAMQVNRASNADLKKLAASRKPAIRFNNVGNIGTQEPQDKTDNVWIEINPDTISGVSAVAYSFAETLHDTLNIPIGIIENAWGGSAAEAWVPRDVIAKDDQLKSIHAEWLEIESGYNFDEEMADYEVRHERWQAAVKEARANGVEPPRAPPRKPQNRMTGQHRPANLWNGRLLPIAPIAMRGAIWYQGESNAHTIEKAQQYEHLLSTMITEWRKLWNYNFPFYFVQLADYRGESLFNPDDTWAYLRNSQTNVMRKMLSTGQAVITDIGENKDIHPKQKEEVGRRLARWALNRDYGYSDLAYRSPELDDWHQDGTQVVVNFDYTGSGLRPFDSNEIKGFAVKDSAGQWHVVAGLLAGQDSVALDVPAGVAVKAVAYAWANNPVCNLFTNEGLPVTPFRTDID